MTDQTVPDPAAGGALPVRVRTRLGSYAICVDASERILLVRLSAVELPVPAWTLPGGGVDFGEHPDAAVIRELEEETGLLGAIEELAGIFSHVYPDPRFARGGDLHFLGIVYRVRVVGGALRDEIDGSTDTCAWLSLEEIRALKLVEVARFGVRTAFPGASL